MKASFVFLLIAFCASAQTGRRLVPSDGRGRRIALVIGNDAYLENHLHNAVNDARSMKSALEGAGFTVQIRVDVTQKQMETAIDDFTGGVSPGDIALFFYAGHGMQINDQNYLIPVDFQAHTAVDAKYNAYPAQRVQENLEAAGAAMQILIMDACRNNPFRSWRGGSEGLAAMQAGRGTYIAFATSPGKTAADNPGAKNGLFTGELVTVLREPGLSIDQVFNRVRDQVQQISRGKQLPWSTTSVTGEFYFKVTVEGSVSIPPRESSVPPRDLSGERELAFWNSIKDENDEALLRGYLRTFPAGAFVNIAKAKLNRLKAAVRAAADDTAKTRGYWVDPDTKLMWAMDDNGSDVDWNQAKAYCRDLRIAGYSGWALPHISELRGLVDEDEPKPKGGIRAWFFAWSDTTTKPGEAWHLHFNSDFERSGRIDDSNNERALCVRRSGE